MSSGANAARVTHRCRPGAQRAPLAALALTAAALAQMAAGADGCISVTANVAPRQLSAMHVLCQQGDFAKARAIHERLAPLHEALFVETSPGPVKFAASLLGKCRADIRLPLVEPGEPTRARVRAAMVHAGLLN